MKKLLPFILFTVLTLGSFCFISFQNLDHPRILTHTVDLSKQHLEFYWKDDKGKNLLNFDNLSRWLNTKHQKLVFAMNGGMYLKDRSPQGLFVQNGVEKKRLNKVQNAYGNFYLQPNGVFFITDKNEGMVCQTSEFSAEGVKFATQSGPMLVINGKLHSKFREGSNNLNIRNGVGVLPDGKLLFAMSKEEINLFDFATFFKEQGCENALYLDGFVSRTYLPSKNWVSTDGSFGVMIGETEKM